MLSKIKDFRSSFYQIPLAEGKKLKKLEQKKCIKQLHCPGQVSKKDNDFCLAPSLFTQFLPYSSTSRNFFSGLSNYSQMLIDAHVSSPNYYIFPALRNPETNGNGRWKGFSKRKTNSLSKRSYSNFPQGNNPVETNRNNKTINDKSYLSQLKNNIQNILDKQIKQINELRSKRVKKDIHSAVSLQKMVVDRIREANKPEKFMNLRHNKLKSLEQVEKAENMHLTRLKNALVRLEGNSHCYMSNNSTLVPISVKKSQEVRYLDNFKDRYQKEKKCFDNHENEDHSMFNRNNFSKSLDFGKRAASVKNLNIDKSNSVDKDSKSNNCEFNDLRAHEVTAHRKTVHENMPIREKMEKLYQDTKGKILVEDRGFSRIPQFTGVMQNKQEFNQGKLNESEVDRIYKMSAEKKINNEKIRYSFTPAQTKTDVCPFTTTKGDLTTNLPNPAHNSLKSSLYKREEYVRASPRLDKEDIYKPREGRRRQLPNVRRNNRVSQSPNIGFSHNAVYLRDSELYRKFKAVERERHLRTIYNTHWDKGKQRGFDVRKASLVNISQTTSTRPRMFNTTKPVVVHKLNASSIAESIKLRAKALNQNSERDKLLQPQLYCKKSFALGLAQQPIMPCKNIVSRDLGDNVLKKRRIAFSEKETPKHLTSNKLYTKSQKKAPFWANQKMISGNVTMPNSDTISANPKRRKIDIKGALKYIMNFKSRLQQQ